MFRDIYKPTFKTTFETTTKPIMSQSKRNPILAKTETVDIPNRKKVK